MVTIRFNPKALTNEGQIVKNAVFVPHHTVIFYVQFYDFRYRGVRFILSGKVADADTIVRDGDEIIIIPDVRFQAVAAVFAWVFASFAHFAFTVSVLSALYSVVSALTARTRKPSFNTSGDGLDSSPTYGWDGIQNTSEVATPIGIVYGEHRVGGQIIGEYVDTDGDLNYLNILLALCEGEIESISSIEVNQNPIANYSSISYATKLGTNTQDPIPNFRLVHDTRSVNVNLLQSSAQVYTTVGTDLNALAIHLILPNGLYQQDQSSGALNSWTVTYKLEYKKHSDVSYTDLGNIDIEGKSRTAIRRVYTISDLDSDQYDIRITKQSADSDFYHTGDLTWDSVDEITNEDLAYPNTALLSITALATNQLSGGVPTFTSLVKGKKVSQPQVFDGMDEVDWEDYYWNSANSEYRLLSDDTSLTWDGTTYVTKWCANPVWCLRDLLLNTRYGLGNYIDSSIIDLTSFIAMSRYCEEKVPDGNGGFEKRYNLNIVLDASMRAFDMILLIASSFRGLIFYSNGTIKLKIDKVDVPVQLFGMGNIIKGTFQQTWLSLKQRYNLIEVQYINKDIGYLQDTIAVIDNDALLAGDTVRKKQIKIYTTQASQAYREGRFLLWTNKYVKRSISFKASIDAIVCEPGDIISVAHDVPAWGIGSGRVQSGSTTTAVNLDLTVALDSGKTYALMVRHAADDTIEERTITTAPGSVSAVTVGTAFSSAPAEYDAYSIGELTIETKPFRITNIQIDGDNNADIQAIEYNESIYDDTEPTLPGIDYSALSFDIPDVRNLSLTNGLVRASDGTIQNAIDIWFAKPDGTSVYVMYQKAKVYLSDNSGASWVFVGETSGEHFQISDNLLEGTSYKIAVVSVGANGNENIISSSPQASITALAKSTPPEDVSSFLVNQSRDRMFFGWTGVTDLDLSGYEIRFGQAWASGTVLATQIKDTTYISLDLRTGSGQSFFIKAIDTSGNYSETETEATITIDEIPFQNIIESYMEAASWSGTLSSTVVTSSNLLISSGCLAGTYVTPVRDVGFIATFKIGIDAVVVDAGGDRRFDDDTTTEFDDSETAMFSGDEVAGASAFEIKTSEDNITWSDWRAWQNGDYKCRYFQLRLTLTRQSTSQDIQCSQFNYLADLPDVDEYSEELTVSDSGAGLTVTFEKTFHKVPSVAITILSGSGVYAAFSSVPDTTGFTVKLYNAAGVAQTGTFSFHSHGV